VGSEMCICDRAEVTQRLTLRPPSKPVDDKRPPADATSQQARRRAANRR
jgi:hypothetical protein